MRLKYKFELVEIDDQTVAVPIEKGAMEYQGLVKLNESAASIFRMLESDVSEAEIVNCLADEYKADHKLLEADVRNCIALFREKGLLVE